VLAGIVAALLAWLLHVYFWVRRLQVTLPYAETHRCRAGDGGRFELRRVAEVDSELPPVLLVHGLAANHRNHDPTLEDSLARTLVDAGRDVWLLTLRSALKRGGPSTFGAMAREDVPSAIREVQARTDAPQVDYVGFSMGGMLLYAAVAEGLVDEDLIRRGVVVGSPGAIVPPMAIFAWAARLPAPIVPRLPFRVGARSAAFAIDWAHTPLHRIVYNPENLGRGEAARAMVNVLEDVPRPLAAQFGRWMRAGGELVLDGEAILPRLERGRFPLLFVAGEYDRLAPPATVTRAHDGWGGPKRMVVLDSRGHGDLAVGRSAKLSVFPLLVEHICSSDPNRTTRDAQGS